MVLLLRDKKNSCQIFKKRVPAKSSKGFPAQIVQSKIPTVILIPKYQNTDRPVPVIYRYRHGGVKNRYNTTIFTRAMFRPKIKLDVYFFKAVDELWEVVGWVTCSSSR